MPPVHRRLHINLDTTAKNGEKALNGPVCCTAIMNFHIRLFQQPVA
ncbi:hypothetical protein PYK22_00703 [Pyrinomonas methylaliphatogenes]|uniref:Uncharacterized protein n=1 Tax=Pyrinomonas methylaliphatogenes TaxID=454194 RepID=A0A0B6WU06_9BACT|nr:hypothetical protein PYK22_00703 [Pyrinomonas methylaliphatogenes]